MASKRQLQIAYGLAIYFLFIGVLSYAVFPAEAPEEPVRMQFNVTAGKVLFDHKTHVAPAGYGLSCVDCHHHPAEDETDTRACKSCHPAAEGAPLPESCLECHEQDEISESVMEKSGDAFHNQCIGCHQEFDAGPGECAQCHVM